MGSSGSVLPVVLISDCLGRTVELHRGKGTSNPPSADGLLCAQSEQQQLCCALFSLSTEHKMTLWVWKYVQYGKGS